MKRRESEQIGDMIRKFFRQEGLETPLNEYRLVEAWKDVVGKGIASYTQQLYIKNQILYVHLTSPVLRQELMMTRDILVRRLNEHVKAQVITNIIFR
jgi:predicted nucleic acid-binding Zn ribbon protein